ncbi:MAG: hypothetical protein M3342_10395, partial [Bacteroidota bacterium]|nr:hypothetical protein [Bacteroidota bacterium]
LYLYTSAVFSHSDGSGNYGQKPQKVSFMKKSLILFVYVFYSSLTKKYCGKNSLLGNLWS